MTIRLPKASFPSLRPWIAAGIIVLAGLAAYSDSLSGPFVLDDVNSILENPSLRQLGSLSAVLHPPEDSGTGGRPLANLSFALNYAVGGHDVAGYHVVNLLIHLAAALVLLALLRRLFATPPLAVRIAAPARPWLALAVTLLWLLDPVQTEAVTYIAQRTESLMGLFYLLTLYSFVRGVVTERRRWLFAAVLACLGGLATKEVMVTAPAMVLLVDRTFLAGTFHGALRRRRVFYLALAATWLVLALELAGVSHRGVGYATTTGWQYALAECGALLQYLRLTFWPHPLVFDYGLSTAGGWSEHWAPALAIGALLAATAWALGRRPLLGFVGAWFFVLLAPTSSFIPIAGQPMAEHRLYLPSAALLAAAALALWQARRGLLVVGCAIAIPAFAAGTFARNQVYHDEVALWADTLTKRPMNARAHAGLGAVLLRRGDTATAAAAFDRALQLDPEDAKTHNNLGTALVDLKRTPEALRHFQASLRLAPEMASTHYNYGNALMAVKRPGDAAAEFARALQLRPDLAEAHAGLATAWVALGRVADAAEQFRIALQQQPDLTAAHFGLATILAQNGQIAAALPHFAITAHSLPDVFDAQYNFANALFVLERYAEAAPAYQAALRLRPDFADAHNNLATTLALTGHITDAIAQYQEALRLNPAMTSARENLERLQGRPRM